MTEGCSNVYKLAFARDFARVHFVYLINYYCQYLVFEFRLVDFVWCTNVHIYLQVRFSRAIFVPVFTIDRISKNKTCVIVFAHKGKSSFIYNNLLYLVVVMFYCNFVTYYNGSNTQTFVLVTVDTGWLTTTYFLSKNHQSKNVFTPSQLVS